VSRAEVRVRAADGSASFDPAATLVRLRRGTEPPGPFTAGEPSPNEQVEIISYRPEQVEITTKLDSPGWLVLTDAFYPGWQAAIDGQAADILQVNIMFRAVEVPAGEHRVVFEYRPRSFIAGMWISAAALVLLAVGLALTARGSSRP
jgi:uncharacterized membrane protein YfhO